MTEHTVRKQGINFPMARAFPQVCPGWYVFYQ